MPLMRNFATLILFCLLSPVCLAESVLVEISGQVGQGWLFKDPQYPVCAVVTAAHLIQTEHPKARIVRSGGIEGVGTDIRILSRPRRSDAELLNSNDAGNDLGEEERIDLALLRVTGAIENSGCTSSTLGGSLTLTLSRFHAGVITPFFDGAFTRIPLNIVADDHRSILALEAPSEQAELPKGISGSAFLGEDPSVPGNAPIPLAMIIQGENRAHILAVRFDQIRQKVLSALASASKQQSPQIGPLHPLVVNWTGQSISSNCSALQALELKSDCGWQVLPLPKNRYVDITLQIPGENPTASGVSIVINELSDGASGQPIKMIVEGGREGRWSWLNTCFLALNSPVRCDFAQANTQTLRFSIAASAGNPIDIRIKEIYP